MSESSRSRNQGSGRITAENAASHIDYWLFNTGRATARTLHLPSDDSTRNDPDTQCYNVSTPRVAELETVPADNYPVCQTCLAIANGEVTTASGDDHRTQRDVLEDLGVGTEVLDR